MRRNAKEIVDAVKAYFPNVYRPETHFLQELTLLHGIQMPIAGGGEFPLNNANTKRLVGLSDFQGEQIPADASGLLRAVVIRYGTVAAPAEGVAIPSPAVIEYLETRANFPAWLLNSELVLKSSSQEMFRIRVAEFVPSAAAQKIPAEWAKELEKTLKVEGSQTLTLYLNTPEGASDPNADKIEYLQVVLYGVKFAARKTN